VRLFWTAFLILGFFHPLVIQAEPFGTTDVAVYDTDFLPAPEGPVLEALPVPALPDWVSILPVQESSPLVLPPILVPELPS